MRYAVIGGDLRFVHLVRMLGEDGGRAVGFFQEKANGGDAPPVEELESCDIAIANWPMRFPMSAQEPAAEELLSRLRPGAALLLCGPGFPQERREELRWVNLWEDEQLLRENAWLTAEAALGAAVCRSGRTMPGARCAVVGCGRIGNALTLMLLGMGARVTVVSRREEKLRRARLCGADAVPLSGIGDALRGSSFIFSTPPTAVIGRRELESVDAGALIMDLASPPYGVDIEAAREMGLNACREPGLPGRYCPLSAGRAICNAVRRWEEKEDG